MTANDSPNSDPKGNVAKDIRSDLDALRALDESESRANWGPAVAILVLLVCTFAFVGWFGFDQKNSDSPLVYSEKVAVDQALVGGSWVAEALNQALNATLRSSEYVRVANVTESAQLGRRFGGKVQTQSSKDAPWVLQTVVSGSDDDVLSITLVLVDNSGESAQRSATIVGTKNGIFDLAIRCAEQVHAWFGIDGLARDTVSFANNEIPGPKASRLYGSGMAALESLDPTKAIEYFDQALAVSPNNPTILEGLARAWLQLGYRDKYVDAAKRAFEASDKLSRKRQLELEARYAVATETWERASQVYGALKEFSPDDLSYRLALAETLVSQNLGDEFEKSIAEMRSLGGGLGADPRIDLTESWYWYVVGDYSQCAALATKAKQKASERSHLMAEALVAYSRCDDNYNPTLLLEARAIFNELGITSREPEILRQLSQHEYAQGNMSEYLGYLEDAVAVSQEMGNTPQLAASQNSLAQAYDLHGWLERGLALKKEVADYQRVRGNKNRESITLENIGVSLFKLGRYEEALRSYASAETIFHEIGDKIGIAWLPFRRGQIALRQGRLDEARRLMEQAAENAQERPEGNLLLNAHYEQGLYLLYAGQFDSARAQLEKTLKKFQELGLDLSSAEAAIALARVYRALGEPESEEVHLDTAQGLITDDAAYLSLSIAIEMIDFSSAAPPLEMANRCNRLRQSVSNQEHLLYVLRAQINLAMCSVIVDQESATDALDDLDGIIHQAESFDVFEAQIAGKIAKSVVLRMLGESTEADAVEAQVAQRVAQSNWLIRSVPKSVH
ncbi:MAG: tetratricopeptide repeat protein [Pseudomonadota bacterium]